MNVRLASQLLSESVAASIEKLKTIPQTKSRFQNSEPTIKYTRTINNLFDVFNTEMDGHGGLFKTPLNETNKDEIFSFLDETEDYFKKIQLKKMASSNL